MYIIFYRLYYILYNIYCILSVLYYTRCTTYYYILYTIYYRPSQIFMDWRLLKDPPRNLQSSIFNPPNLIFLAQTSFFQLPAKVVHSRIEDRRMKLPGKVFQQSPIHNTIYYMLYTIYYMPCGEYYILCATPSYRRLCTAHYIVQIILQTLQ